MNIEQFKNILNYLLDNNLKLQEEGKTKITINIEGEAGIGKTAIVEQIAKERGADFFRFDVASIEETGDLLGLPIKEYRMISPTGEEKWVSEKVTSQFINMGYTLCEVCEPRMSYTVPFWIPKDEEKEIVIVFDDFTRGNSILMQATMSLVQFGEYLSWKLPKKCHLILTTNPDDGNYTISSLDKAQKSRMMTLSFEFDVNAWAKWAESQNLPDTLINFALLTPELFTKDELVNARTYEMFAKALSNIKDFSAKESLLLINSLAVGTFGTESNVPSLFTIFINNHLDKLISPEKMLNDSWETVQKELESCVNSNNTYRADIASTLTMRFVNYVENYFETNSDKKKSDKVINRIIDIVDSDKMIFTEDLIYSMIRNIYAKFPSRLNKLILNPKIRAKIL